ncbi:MAG: pitrilysin family protein [Rhodospirillaceae bacterium]|nr:pitrilysin family protein [Rhodospirillaceae bacterium]
MSVTVTTLGNGLRVVTDRMDSVETVALGAWVGVGTRHETAEVNGISHLLEHMAFKGTRRRSAQKIAEEMDNVGGHLNAYTSRDHTAYFAKMLKEDTALAVDVIADILLESAMDPEELAREQHVVVQEIYQANDTPDDVIFDRFQATAYPDQPLGWPVLGSEEVVRAIDSPRLKRYLAEHYAAENMIVAASGHIDHDAFAAQVERAFAPLRPAAAVIQAPARYAGGEFRETRDLDQVHLLLGFPGVSYQDADFYPAAAFSVLMGEGMSSRLFQEIREKRGLAYSVYSATQSFSDTGVFSIYVGTGPDDLPTLLPVLTAEIRKAADTITPEETRRAKAQLKSSLLMSLESPSSRCNQCARQLAIYGRPLTTAEIIEKVEAVDAAAIAAAAGRIFSGAPTMASIGQLDRLPTLEEFHAGLR